MTTKKFARTVTLNACCINTGRKRSLSFKARAGLSWMMELDSDFDFLTNADAGVIGTN